MKRIETTAIIVSRNRLELVKRLIADLLAQDYSGDKLEIIVVDDASEQAYNLGSHATVIRNNERCGATKSRNKALAAACGKYFLLLDDDVSLRSTNLITRLLEVLNSNSSIGAVFPKKMDVRPGGEYEFSCSRAVFYSGDLRRAGCTRGTIEFGCQVFLTRADIIRQLGGYDTRFGLGIGHSFREESDLHFKIRKSGYRLFLEPSVEIAHNIVSQGGHGQDNEKYLYWMSHNHIVFLANNFSLWRLKAVGYLFDLLYYALCYGKMMHLGAALSGYKKGFETVKKR